MIAQSIKGFRQFRMLVAALSVISPVWVNARMAGAASALIFSTSELVSRGTPAIVAISSRVWVAHFAEICKMLSLPRSIRGQLQRDIGSRVESLARRRLQRYGTNG